MFCGAWCGLAAEWRWVILSYQFYMRVYASESTCPSIECSFAENTLNSMWMWLCGHYKNVIKRTSLIKKQTQSTLARECKCMYVFLKRIHAFLSFRGSYDMVAFSTLKLDEK